jgi:hypothetical protein
LRELLDRAKLEAATLVSSEPHDNETARQINERIQRLAS